MSFLEIKNLSISFGGVKAVDDVSFSIEEGSVYAIIGPNGAGKSTIFNLLSRFYEPLSGQLNFSGNDLLELGAKDIARLGIARTFQNLELFEHASVLQNLLVGRHVHNNQSWWRQMLFTRSVVEAELEHRRKVEEVIDFLELAHYRNQMISGLPYG
ncbi:MAG TPA: ATP-binding cassette domain-containing protein, partial [Candidatus Thioglobus sp.]|nr:ATP-binding cassette domain-containing protein [Candidatus Thioglobus sp.]